MDLFAWKKEYFREGNYLKKYTLQDSVTRAKYSPINFT